MIRTELNGTDFTFGYAIVERQTESDFFDKVLNPYLNNLNIHISPIVLETSPGHKGGCVDIDRVARDYRRIASHSITKVIAICLDFHKIPSNFPGYSVTNNPVLGAEIIQKELRVHLGDDHRLFPYIQLHDFEALLFSDVHAFYRTGVCTTGMVESLIAIRNQFESPEHINHGKPPVYRIQSVIPSYRKRVNGPTVALEIGIETIKVECPHFSKWLHDLIAFCNRPDK